MRSASNANRCRRGHGQVMLHGKDGRAILVCDDFGVAVTEGEHGAALSVVLKSHQLRELAAVLQEQADRIEHGIFE